MSEATNDTMNGKQFVQWVADELAKDGLVRTSTMGGGEITGWTNSVGSTGRSIRDLGKHSWGEREPGKVDLHIVLSGEACGLSYRSYKEYSEDSGVMNMHEPINQDRLCPKIKATLTRIGLKVHEVRASGHQCHWDDDVNFNAKIDRPSWLLDGNGK